MSENNKREYKKNVRGRKARKKVCAFCSEKVESIDYKDVNRLRKFELKEVRYYQEESVELVLNIKEN